MSSSNGADLAQGARISVRSLSKTYRTRRGATLALDDLSLDVADGEILVLLGPSGCGKTTLLRCVAGLEMPDVGEIVIHDRKVFSSSQRVYVAPEHRRLSMVFQSYALWPHMTVAENVAYPLENVGRPRREIDERVKAVLSVVGLALLGAAYPGQLSGGQQQRVALARAIVSNEGVILFDEPLSNLDAKVRERIRGDLLALHHDIRFSALYVTHDQIEATALADRLAVMQTGRIAQVGSPTEIYYAPESRYVAEFVGSANAIDGTLGDASATGVCIDTPLGRLTARAAEVKGMNVGAHSREREALAPGMRVTALFRPEQCRLEAVAGANQLEGVVVHSTFLGSYVEYEIRVGEHTLVVRAMGGDLRAEGSDVCVSFAPEHVRVYPVE